MLLILELGLFLGGLFEALNLIEERVKSYLVGLVIARHPPRGVNSVELDRPHLKSALILLVLFADHSVLTELQVKVLQLVSLTFHQAAQVLIPVSDASELLYLEVSVFQPVSNVD